MIRFLPSANMEGTTPVIHLGYLGIAIITGLIVWTVYKLYRGIYPKQILSGMAQSWNEPRKFVKSRVRTGK